MSTDNFDAFTEHAKTALRLAQVEAVRFQRNTVGTEHLLVALMCEQWGIAANTLRNTGITIGKVYEEIEKLDKHDEAPGLSPQVTQSLDLAREEARNRKHDYIGTEHLLLGLMRLSDSAAANIVKNLGVSPDTVRLQTLRAIATEKSSSSSTPPSRQRFDKFDERARKVLSLAHEEAQRLQHNYIGPEHLLLGLLRGNDGVAATVLHNLGITLESMRHDIETTLKQDDSLVPGEGGMSLRAKRIIELAVDEERRLNHHYIGTEHLLLGLAREGAGVDASPLEKRGVTLEKVRIQVIQVLAQSDATSTEAQQAEGAPSPGKTPGEAKISWEEAHLGKLNEQTRKVLELAQDEARRFRHNYIGTEHLLLGLTRDQDGIATGVLARLGVGLDQVRRSIEFIIGYGDKVVVGKAGLTPRSKKVIELAIDEAKRLNQSLVGTEHLLLGLVREGMGIAAGVLESMGINLARVRQQTLDLLSQEEGNTSAATSSSSPASPSIEAFKQAYHLTEAAEKVLDLAQGEAHLLHHDRISPEHLLLGLLHEKQDAAATILQSFNIDLAQARSAVEDLMGQGQRLTQDELHLTPLAWAYLYLAADEAQRLGQQQIDTPHILLALTQGIHETIPTLLASPGTTTAAIRAKTLEHLQ